MSVGRAAFRRARGGWIAVVATLVGRHAAAEEAHDQRFARPPPSAAVAADTTDDEAGDDDEARLRTSAVRVEAGPGLMTTGAGVGPGVELALAFGRSTVQGRVSGAWFRGERGGANETPPPSGDSLARYAGEVIVQLVRRGALVPSLGVGAGLVRVAGARAGYAGVALGRAALDYRLPVDDADVRVGLSLEGALAGPADTSLEPLRAYALSGAHVVIGF